MQRRRFLQIAAASAMSLDTNLAHAATPIKAIAFDGFVIFDPKSIAVLAERLFPGKGVELMNTWRLRQFEYSWLRNSMLRYADFWTVTREALVFAARFAKLDLSEEKRDQLKLPKQEILFAAFGGWDAAGAKSFGYETYWANRLSLPVEELGIVPDAIAGGVAELAKFAIRA